MPKRPIKEFNKSDHYARPIKVKKSNLILNDEDHEPDFKSPEFMYDEVDQFDLDRDKILLNSDDSVDKDEFEEILPLGDDDDDDEEEENDDNINDYYSRMLQKETIASDIEDEDDDLPDVKAWGKKKKTYYNTDYVDGDYGGNFQGGEEEELADIEEEEAKKIQKRLLEQINEEDFGLEWIKPVEIDKEEKEEKVTLDLSKLSKNEKLDLIKKESPEFLELIEDFKFLLMEVQEKLQPLMSYAKDGKLPQVAEYVLLKHELILLYCTNISFYMALKSRGTLTRRHPILKKLAYFKKFLKELKPVDDKLMPYIDTVLEKIRNKESIEEETPETILEIKEKPKKKKLRVMKAMEEKISKKKVRFEDETRSIKRQETSDEKNALELYQLMKAGRRTSGEESDSDEITNDSGESENEKMDDGNQNKELETDEQEESFNDKRGITYQIAKNKGLTPHRKKEYRNPRVKHKMKFRKAKIRRKGQIREVRTELQRYGGEVSGIRIGVKHGRKLK